MILEQTLNRLAYLYRQDSMTEPKLQTIGLKQGWTTVVGTGNEHGTAFRFSGFHDIYQLGSPDLDVLQQLIGQGLLEVARRHLDDEAIQMRSIAVAAVSALSQPYMTSEALAQRGYQAQKDRNFIADVVNADDKVVLIGYGGMVKNLLGRCKSLHVADMRPKTSLASVLIGEKVKFFPRNLFIHGAEEDKALLNSCDVAIITASSIVNNTFDELLGYAATARTRCVYGASISMIPDIFLDSGVDYILTHHTSAPERFAEAMRNDDNMEAAIRKTQSYLMLCST